MLEVGYALGNEGQVAGFIAFAAVGYRRQVRAVGFEQQVPGVHEGQHFVEAAVLEGRHAADAQQEAQFDGLPGVVEGAAEAVEHAGKSFGALPPEQCHSFGKRVAAVDDDGQPVLFGPRQLDGKRFFLLRLEFHRPVVVEPDLPDGGEGPLLQPAFHGGQFPFVTCRHVARVQAHRGNAAAGVGFFQGQHAFDGSTVDVGHVNPAHSAAKGLFEHGVAVTAELRRVNVGVAVDHWY